MGSEEKKPSTDPSSGRRLPSSSLKDALQELKQAIDSEYDAYLNACVRCGLCADSCHYYLTDGESASIPAHKLHLVASVVRRNFSYTGRYIPFLTRARAFDSDMVDRWIDDLFGRCSLCGRCSLNCSIGIGIHRVIRLGRSTLARLNAVPQSLQSTVDKALTSGNNMGIQREDWLDTLSWIEEELQSEIGDTRLRMPVDQSGARVLYAVNPREPMFYPLSLSAAGKIFHAAGESWTLASDFFDVTNYGLFNGDDKTAGELSDRLARTMERLGCETLVLSECGHGYNANRWEAPEWLKRRNAFEVKSLLEVMGDYIRSGRIRLDPSKNSERVTLHDPCNLVRLGGVVDEQRFILRHAVENFVEMTPCREKNFCCGGGGGQLSMTPFAERRIRAGKIKADQISATEAKIVATPCHNCIDQLGELNRHYKLGVSIVSVGELVAEALILDRPSES
ncbi:MAG TPA: (Fe-S)-binding protein [Thermoanaerobaculia bacterium]|nr:(Fe-S)-binding protein [Thermoanaerobaculia bacterium]HUM30736.1 (Fe-S)-binding protein [Thermoanaerobaculia bacterium]HXK68975.1 (Fe-S)-binding protein [Thermoanaerobaculia bacterium]